MHSSPTPQLSLPFWYLGTCMGSISVAVFCCRYPSSPLLFISRTVNAVLSLAVCQDASRAHRSLHALLLGEHGAAVPWIRCRRLHDDPRCRARMRSAGSWRHCCMPGSVTTSALCCSAGCWCRILRDGFHSSPSPLSYVYRRCPTMVHWRAALPAQLSLPLPRTVQLDWEAILTPTVDEFVHNAMVRPSLHPPPHSPSLCAALLVDACHHITSPVLRCSRGCSRHSYLSSRRRFPPASLR